MSIQQNFPAITPSLSLNFARSKTLDPRITFTRTSSATRINERGLVEVVPANSPRFDHSYDPVSGSVRSLGLLVEESRSNLLSLSEEFDNWFKIGTQVTQNNILSPSNQSTADLIEVITSGGSKSVSRDALTTIGSTYTLSVFAKSANSTTFSMGLFTNAFIGLYNFNLTGSGSIITQSAGISASIIPYPNGWYRCSLTATTNGSGTTTLIYPNTTVNSIGNSIYLWGAQLEQGSFPTSYIPTTNSTVTRTADNASIQGKAFQDFFNPSEGTTVIQIQNYNISNTSTSLFSYSGTTVPNNSMNYFRQLDAQPVGQIIFNGTLPMNIGLGAVWTDSSLQKHAFFYQKDNSGIANRSLVSLDTSVDIPVVERMTIGNSNTLQTNNKFTLSQLTYYPKRLSNSQLQTLTR